MNIKMWTLIFLITIPMHAAQAVPITNLLVSDANITVGEQFTVEVWLQNDVTTEELLSFGFDVASTSPLVNYTSFSIGPNFIDASFGANNISGLSFPGITDSSVLLASLAFDAVGVGNAEISISGIFDAMFFGLFYENSGFNIESTANITIQALPNSVPEPALLWLILIPLLMSFRQSRLITGTIVSR